jgi:hypothetical protein
MYSCYVKQKLTHLECYYKSLWKLKRICVRPVKVLDQSEKELRNKKISMIKILWRSSQIEEETWERESKMRRKHPELFQYSGMT